jgi:hypothetical protein
MRRTVMAAMLGLSVVPSLQAQTRRANNPPPAAPAPAAAPRQRVGTAASPTPPPQQQAPVQVVQPVYYYSPDGYAVYGSPYVGLADGSVLVNFGNGYERVLRACAPVRQPTPSDPWAKDALGRIPAPPGIAAIQNGTRGQAMGAAPAQNAQACYRTDANGRVNVVAY